LKLSFLRETGAALKCEFLELSTSINVGKFYKKSYFKLIYKKYIFAKVGFRNFIYKISVIMYNCFQIFYI